MKQGRENQELSGVKRMARRERLVRKQVRAVAVSEVERRKGDYKGNRSEAQSGHGSRMGP